MPEAPKVRVASTGTKPELVDTVPIVRAAKPGDSRRVVLALGPDSKTDLPLPQDLRPGDVLRIYAELEVTTDYEKRVKGSMGTPYGYAPRMEAVALLARDPQATAHAPGRAHSIVKTPSIKCTHERHHEVITIAGAEYVVPAGGLPWNGPVFVNVALSAAHPAAQTGNVLLVGENEPEPRVDQDTGGIRVVRLRPGSQRALAPVREERVRRTAGVPITKKSTVVFTQPLRNLRKGEQLFVHGRLVADAKRPGYATRLSARMFVAEDPKQADPDGAVKEIASWSGHLSKENGCNCLPGKGNQRLDKFGVLRIRRDVPRTLHVNLVATSAAPFRNPPETGDDLPIERGSFLDVVRYPAELEG